MSITRIASRYAKSLIDLAKSRNELEAVKEDVQGFQKAMESKDFYHMLKSPVIPSTKKAEIFKLLFKEKANPTTFGFFNLVIRKGREMYMPEILNEFMASYRKMNNIVSVNVISAVPLNAAAQEAIKARLIEAGLITGSIEMHTKVNPDIIGGFQIEFDHKLIDTSISHALDKMRRELAINLYESKIRSL